MKKTNYMEVKEPKSLKYAFKLFMGAAVFSAFIVLLGLIFNQVR